MKKKVLIIVGIILVLIVLIGICKSNSTLKDSKKEISNLNNTENTEKSESEIIEIANKLYGNEVCESTDNDGQIIKSDNLHSSIGLDVMSKYTCKICGKSYEFGSSPTPRICGSCAEITGRCKWCGKLKK